MTFNGATFNDIFDPVTQAVFAVVDGKVAMMNAAARALCGGKDAADVLPGEAFDCAGEKAFFAMLNSVGCSVSVKPLEDMTLVYASASDEYFDINVSDSLEYALRSPAANLWLTAGMLRSVTDYLGNDEASQYASMLGRDSARVKRLADNIGVLARMQNGTYEINRKPMELEPFVREIAETTALLAGDRGVAVSFATPLSSCPAVADAEALELALLQVLSNAVKNAGRGGFADIFLNAENGRAFITVEDSGGGLTPDRLANAFSAYRQAVDTSQPQRGAGFGLAIVSNIVRAHGGIALIENGREGCRVTLALPLDKACETQKTENSEPENEKPEIRVREQAMSRALIQLSDALGYREFSAKYLE